MYKMFKKSISIYKKILMIFENISNKNEILKNERKIYQIIYSLKPFNFQFSEIFFNVNIHSIFKY